jgi:hypothetical protein
MVSSGMLCRVPLVRTVSEELTTSFIRVTSISEVETTLAVAPKHRFLQEPHGVTSQKTPFFIQFVLSNLSHTVVGKMNAQVFTLLSLD